MPERAQRRLAALAQNIGLLTTGNNLNFTTNDFSIGRAFVGCIRKVRFANDTTLGVPPITSLGTSYCGPAVANSTGMPGAITADGSAAVTDNDVTLTASMLPAGSFGFFLTSQAQSLVMNPGGSSGNLCLGNPIGRYVGSGQILNSGTAGEFSLVLDLTQTPTPTGLVSITAGQTWNFQSWYRDSVGGTATSNFTDGYSIAFM